MLFAHREAVPRLVELIGAEQGARSADAVAEATPERHWTSKPARLAGSPDDERYVRRVIRAFSAGRIGAAALVTLLVSAEVLASSQVLAFFSPAEIALAWLQHAAELAVLAAVLTVTYALFEQAVWRQPRSRRLPLCCAVLLGLSSLVTLLLYGYYAHGFAHLPPLLHLLAESLRFGLPAVFLVLIADVHHRALEVDAAAHAAELARSQLGHDENEQQLALLQAQIEPHFLFNVLGNLRRLYRTQPQAGADAIGSLMRYLRAALPQLRSRQATLGDELELVRAYLDLLQVRMGERLAFFIDAEAAHESLEFPPMLLMTLVENAIKHGVEPIGGGSVCVRVHGDGDTLHVAVIDDGAGLGGAPSRGGGVGLVNVRRQLAARYGNRAQLTLESRPPRGTRAAIIIPRRPGSTSGDVRRPGAPDGPDQEG